MKLSEAKKMRGLIEKAADNGLDDADALEGVALFPPLVSDGRLCRRPACQL